MRKILLGTSAVVGAALISMGAAQAQQAPQVRVGGFMFGMYNWIDDNLDYGRSLAGTRADGTTRLQPTGAGFQGTQRRSTNDFRHELEVQVFVTGKAANGMSYGGVIEIQNDGVGGGGGTALDLDEAYVFVSTPTLGTLRFGEEDSAASILQVRVPSITGFGPDGDWDDGAVNATAVTGGGPSLLTGINDGNDATKIVYLSPQFFGFDFGLSYNPNQGEGERVFVGRSVDNISSIPLQPLQRDYTTLTNEISGAIRYRGSFGNIGVAAGFAAMRADGARWDGVTNTRLFNRDVSAYSVGLNLTGYGFTVGGEYTWGNYSGISVGRGSLARNADGSNRDASSHWILGATYTTGALAFGAFYGIATQDNGPGFGDREQTVWGIGAAYTLAPGLELVASYNQLRDDNVVVSGAAYKRELDVVLLGARLAF
ncbi:porin [Falsiroseomonas oryziterrae]|uniref:porin n=1 Tax=Falsiroseomonas oryziterrae TaxID=2911368 RepID=UPI001F23450C|nr:porin [Roseomonas sp. NPKOSM-4]